MAPLRRGAFVNLLLAQALACASLACIDRTLQIESFCVPETTCSLAHDAGAAAFPDASAHLPEARSACGDGRLAPGEGCDDGNVEAGDGCDPRCEVEEGFGCAGSPSGCEEICGDGLIVGNETCDDGNHRDGDGCSARCVLRARWRPIPGDPALSPRYAMASVLANDEVFIFGGELLRYVDQPFGVSAGDGAIYNPEARTWRSVNSSGAPSPRSAARAVWTGSEIIVWGGSDTRTYNDGARFDPVSNTWRPMAPNPAIIGRSEHSVVWTGTEMIVFGGWGPERADSAWGALSGGEAYDPSTDTWRSLPREGAPVGRQGHTAVWTGTEMIVFGGRPLAWDPVLGDGGAYDPALDQWRPIRAHVPRAQHAAVWTGAEMIVVGGAPASGAAYDPVLDTWRPIAPHPDDHSDYTQALWTGSELYWIAGLYRQTQGAKYVPAIDRWSDLPAHGTPTGKFGVAAAITSRWLVAFSGELDVINGRSVPSETSGQLDLESEQWTPMRSGAHIEPRIDHSAVAIGSEMIVWGGALDEAHLLSDGARIALVSGERRPLPSQGAPAGRILHSAVATDDEMIIWGGRSSWSEVTPRSALGDGAIFSSADGLWTEMPTENAPSARSAHGSVLAGHDLIVFGGTDGGQFLGDGAAFDVSTRTWRPLAQDAALPSPRADPTLVWTGQEVLVWGGRGSTGPRGDGAAYDPALDRWRAISAEGAPTPRTNHTATWTGREMIVFGGEAEGGALATGARYDPAEDLWTELPEPGAPSARARHTSVWSGAEVIIFGGLTAGAELGGGILDL